MSDQTNQADAGVNADADRNSRRVIQGVVKGDKTQKTITVSVERRFKHAKYKKYICHHSTVYAHDETDDARIGDTVEIMECRPLSKTKRWRLIRVIARTKLAAGGVL